MVHLAYLNLRTIPTKNINMWNVSVIELVLPRNAHVKTQTFKQPYHGRTNIKHPAES